MALRDLDLTRDYRVSLELCVSAEDAQGAVELVERMLSYRDVVGGDQFAWLHEITLEVR